MGRAAGTGSALLLRLVALQVLDVALLLLLLYPGLELFVALGGCELVPDLRLDFLQRAGLLGPYLRDLDDVVAELGLYGADDLALFGVEEGLLEAGYGLALAKAAEVPAPLGAPRVLGVLSSEPGEVCPVLELALDLLGLRPLVLAEEDVPGAALHASHPLQ